MFLATSTSKPSFKVNVIEAVIKFVTENHLQKLQYKSEESWNISIFPLFDFHRNAKIGYFHME